MLTDNSNTEKLFADYPEWDGQETHFESWLLSVKGVVNNPTLTSRLGGDQHVCMTTFAKIPEARRDEVSAYIRERLEDPVVDSEGYTTPVPAFSTKDWLALLATTFLPKDIKPKSQAKILRIRQGPAQTFASFRADFDTLCTRAAELAPTHAAKIQIMKTALSSRLRDAIAVRGGCSNTNYTAFVTSVQLLATDLEGLPEFQARRGSKVSLFVDANGTIINSGAPADAAPQHHGIEKDGDTRMTGVNAIGTVTDMQQLAAVLLAALDARSGSRGGNTFAADPRPHAPPTNQATRDALKGEGKCERCKKFPSHPWSQCEYRNFKDNPTPVGRSRVAAAGARRPGNG